MFKHSLSILATAIAVAGSSLPVYASGSEDMISQQLNGKGVIVIGTGQLADCPELNLPGIIIPGLPDCNFPEIPGLPGEPDTEQPEGPDTELPEEPDTEQPDLPDTELPEEPDTELPDTPDTELPDMPDTEQPDVPGEDQPGDDNADEDTSFARQVVDLVNQERAKEGLSPLSIDEKAVSAAQVRAREIETSFSHTRPNGSSFSTALTESGASYRGAGENIAWGQKTPEEVMKGWMNSPGHRANIMNEKFTSIGVGYYQNAKGVNYWTQLFTY
ncbi:transporter [Lactonifactor longoviformis]|uniref:Cysteine-rich secretory protein family protein n=1 Tax=Lactonifactor longoviformis DSM 17459 TaxID=1122155 RepID=A0A1M4SUV2_9CLOT|nr:CAP domain-containing protein [Lactonifactor longoviformis]POP33006.1 transporter [Lactonifactor longoviformis]SHE35980.1 Cysteine-rich secretory protein family protein [Lactonifactor longoviformis DSM 17459]